MRRADARRVAAYRYGVPPFPSGGKNAPAVTGTGLAKQPEATYTKREPRLLLVAEAGVGTARERPFYVHGYHYLVLIFDPVSGAQIRGQPLIGVRRQKQDQYQREERDQKQAPHG